MRFIKNKILTTTFLALIIALPSAVSAVTFPSPLGATTPQELIGTIIRAVMGLVGSVALLMFLYGGFLWMTAGGSPEKIEKGKNTLLWATLGLVVIFGAYAVVNFVLTRLQ